MGRDTKVEWCDHTFNPWRGCTKVSPGCAHCYAETMSHRNPAVLGEWGPSGTRVPAAESYWRQPLAWDREAAASGVRRRVFCASLADVFEDRPELDPWRDRLFDLILATPHLDWLLLTKRPENIRGKVPSKWLQAWPEHAWVGTSVENQEAADSRIPHLLKVPARVRFLSCEPLLGPVDLLPFLDPTGACCGGEPEHRCRDCPADRYRVFDENGYPGMGIHWVIVGGESGPKARPMHPDWSREIRDHCVASGVAFHFKQHGEWISDLDYDPSTMPPIGELANRPVPTHYFGEDSDDAEAYRVGKKAAGRMLDGRTWDEFPKIAEVA